MRSVTAKLTISFLTQPLRDSSVIKNPFLTLRRTAPRKIDMSHKRKGQLTVTAEWAKHLRKFLRRQFWKGERQAGQKLIRKEISDQTNR